MYVNVYICIHTGKAEGSGCECFNDLEGGIAAVTSGEGEFFFFMLFFAFYYASMTWKVALQPLHQEKVRI
jgi:hypothetical protein